MTPFFRRTKKSLRPRSSELYPGSSAGFAALRPTSRRLYLMCCKLDVDVFIGRREVSRRSPTARHSRCPRHDSPFEIEGRIHRHAECNFFA